jgi:signal transduction histidine kinase
MGRAPSFRARMLLVVLAAAVAPLLLVGFWTARATARSGVELLRERLDESLHRAVAEIGGRWPRVRADLLDVGQAGTRHADDGAPGPAYGLYIDVPVYDAGGRRTAAVRAHVPFDALLSEGARTAAAAGAVLGVFDTAGTPLLPLPFDPALLRDERFTWGGDAWLTRRTTMHDPPLLLVAAAPLAPFTRPFQHAARHATLLLAVVAIGALGFAAALTGRMTRSLEQLVAATEAVSRGELERRLVAGDDEVGRVARAFNTMTENLRRMLRELADREALAAVGEFAASLAHEVRNPLTAIRLDLQMLAEELPAGSPLREVQAQALVEVERLDATVAGALDVARSGSVQATNIDVLAPLRAAARAALPELFRHGAMLVLPPLDAPPVTLRGDANALEQVFLNILLNAAQALDGEGRVAVDVRAEGDTAVISIADDGRGIPPDALQRVFDPLFSTRAGGTGLGLAVTRRIVLAHFGSLHIESQPGAGTTVHVRLPLRTA